MKQKYESQQQDNNNNKRHRRRQIKFNVQNNYQSLYTKDQPPLKFLTCVFCKMEKAVKEFSEMQVAKATYNLYAPSFLTNNDSKYISCLSCTDSQRTTLTCWKCSKTKQLNEFSKLQRKHDDNARCFECMKRRNDEDVNDSEPNYSSDEFDEWD